jgi:hypothetical protein
MKIRCTIIAAWAATFAPVQTDLAQAAYSGSDASKWGELSAEVGVGINSLARDSVRHQAKLSFKTEVRELTFPYGIIINQTISRNDNRNHNRFHSYTVDWRNRHSCYSPAGVCTRWNKARRHGPRGYSEGREDR